MNIHTRKTTNGSIDVVFHIPTPEGTNSVGIPWCDCVKDSLRYPKHSRALQKDDLPAIEAGTIIEHYETYTFSRSDLTDAEKKAEIETRYINKQNEIYSELQKTLKYYGFEEDV